MYVNGRMADSAAPPSQQFQTLHIRSDSESKMEDLFRVLKNPGNAQLPYIKRDLPASFFNPSINRGSNENFSTSGIILQNQPAPLPVLHTRSRSSPAQIQHPLSVPTTSAVQNQHTKQTSMGNFIDGSDESPLPPGWEVAKTVEGVRYFIK